MAFIHDVTLVTITCTSFFFLRDNESPLTFYEDSQTGTLPKKKSHMVSAQFANHTYFKS